MKYKVYVAALILTAMPRVSGHPILDHRSKQLDYTSNIEKSQQSSRPQGVSQLIPDKQTIRAVLNIPEIARLPRQVGGAGGSAGGGTGGGSAGGSGGGSAPGGSAGGGTGGGAVGGGGGGTGGSAGGGTGGGSAGGPGGGANSGGSAGGGTGGGAVGGSGGGGNFKRGFLILSRQESPGGAGGSAGGGTGGGSVGGTGGGGGGGSAGGGTGGGSGGGSAGGTGGGNGGGSAGGGSGGGSAGGSGGGNGGGRLLEEGQEAVLLGVLEVVMGAGSVGGGTGGGGAGGSGGTVMSKAINPLHPAVMPTPEQALKLSDIPGPDANKALHYIDRKSHTSFDVSKEVWTGLGLPETSLTAVRLPGKEGPALPSSFKIGILGQASIGLSALAAAQVHALRNKTSVPSVTVPLEHAVIEYKSERLYTVSDELAPASGGAIGGLHKTSDGYVRIHDGFPNHVQGTLDLLGLKAGATRQQVSEQTADWASIDLENCGTAEGKVAIYALRSYRQWDKLPQSMAISNFPISIKQVSKSTPIGLPSRMQPGNLKCLQGLRVVEMSRVIAAPLCGKTLAAHGAEVIWVTSPTLPDLPRVDREFGRGKKTVQLDIHKAEDRKQLLSLLKDCDVFVQGYRPGSLASYGLSHDELRNINPNIIVANMSAFGPEGPWSGRRGFDSLVQTCSGMNVSEAEHAGKGEAARPTPCQALDHSGGYMLAVGVMAAVYHRAVKGGSWRVDVSLAGMMKYLRSLGQYPGASGFEASDFEKPEDVPEEYFEVQETGFGTMKSIRHSATIEGLEVGWDIMPKPLGSDKPAWD
ncbi:hypothetical protein CEK27_001957 [Fusarium fujikuroi]|nr:hypothetical protein CEK27_001957 [Fusarium fujikuroi]